MSCVNRREVIYWGGERRCRSNFWGPCSAVHEAQRVLKIARRAYPFRKDLVLEKRDDEQFGDGDDVECRGQESADATRTLKGTKPNIGTQGGGICCERRSSISSSTTHSPQPLLLKSHRGWTGDDQRSFPKCIDLVIQTPHGVNARVVVQVCIQKNHAARDRTGRACDASVCIERQVKAGGDGMDEAEACVWV